MSSRRDSTIEWGREAKHDYLEKVQDEADKAKQDALRIRRRRPKGRRAK